MCTLLEFVFILSTFTFTSLHVLNQLSTFTPSVITCYKNLMRRDEVLSLWRLDNVKLGSWLVTGLWIAGFGGDIELDLHITMEIDIIFVEHVAKRKHVDNEQKGPQYWALWHTSSDRRWTSRVRCWLKLLWSLPGGPPIMSLVLRQVSAVTPLYLVLACSGTDGFSIQFYICTCVC